MDDPESIGLAIGVVIAASLALQTGLGPSVAAVVDALKATGRVPTGWSGATSLAVGTAFGLATGLIAWQMSGETRWLLIGAFAGLLVGAGGIHSHQARIGAETLRARSEGRTERSTILQRDVLRASQTSARSVTSTITVDEPGTVDEPAFTPWPSADETRLSTAVCGAAAAAPHGFRG